MNDREFVIINQYLENINHTIRLVENSNDLINNLLINHTNNSVTNNRRRRIYRYNQPRSDNYNGLYQNTFRYFDSPFNNRGNNNNINNRNNNNDNNNNNNIQDHENINNNSQTYVLRFDTLVPNLNNIINTMNDNSNNQEISYNILNITEENKDNINELIHNHDLLDIEKFEYINEPVNDVCPITKDRFYNNQNVIMICSCKHIFNKSSLNIWIRNNNNCPNCRTTIKQNN